jgi:hypothetical protein
MRAYVPNIDYSYSCSHKDLLTQVSWLTATALTKVAGGGIGRTLLMGCSSSLRVLCLR